MWKETKKLQILQTIDFSNKKKNAYDIKVYYSRVYCFTDSFHEKVIFKTKTQEEVLSLRSEKFFGINNRREAKKIKESTFLEFVEVLEK